MNLRACVHALVHAFTCGALGRSKRACEGLTYPRPSSKTVDNDLHHWPENMEGICSVAWSSGMRMEIDTVSPF